MPSIGALKNTDICTRHRRNVRGNESTDVYSSASPAGRALRIAAKCS
jgi:hypothetical protein